jgi:hypothetical protein
MTMTAAEHFEKAEELLAMAETNARTPDISLAQATRAGAHLETARFLFDIETAMEGHGCPPGTAAYRTGLDVIAEKRRAD